MSKDRSLKSSGHSRSKTHPGQLRASLRKRKNKLLRAESYFIYKSNPVKKLIGKSKRAEINQLIF